jgi:Rps23 Pro-64 3,4-dihydroxylase Tpa1-like proline 4-hydroxylase
MHDCRVGSGRSHSHRNVTLFILWAGAEVELELRAEQSDTDLVDLVSLEQGVERLGAVYRSATPFPHIVLDNFLNQEAAQRAMKEFPALDSRRWNSYVHVNERKFRHLDPTSWSPHLQSILEELNSPRFVQFLSNLTGIEGLFPDPSLEGGGLHQSTTGGFLNIHADFTVHPHHRNWSRQVNLLLYLSDDWRTEYGGDLELWSADMKRCERTLSPLANRVVIFTTSSDSFHGHPEPMPCPPDVARRSLALYYFKLEDRPVVRSTEYRGRPGERAQSILIYADKQLLRAYDRAKRHLGLSDQTAFTILGRLDRFRKRRDRHKRE